MQIPQTLQSDWEIWPNSATGPQTVEGLWKSFVRQSGLFFLLCLFISQGNSPEGCVGVEGEQERVSVMAGYDQHL